MTLSFLEHLFQLVGQNPLEGFQLLSARAIDGDQLAAGQPIVITGIRDVPTLNHVKEILLKKYPSSHQAAFVHGIATSKERINWFTFSETSVEGIAEHKNILFLPRLKQDERVRFFQTLQFYMDEITGEGGDVWIKQQDHTTLIPYLYEETEELVQAIKNDDRDNMIEELGDLLCHVFYQTSYAEHAGEFALEDVLEVLNEKLRRRHPHVFDGVQANTVEEVDAIWQAIKARERKGNE
ncbi:MAG: hypothetical protein L0K82_03360 [Pisciglobus halotolerans]|nr:hypothetical protein [Pisciglobus halotolerans]